MPTKFYIAPLLSLTFVLTGCSGADDMRSDNRPTHLMQQPEALDSERAVELLDQLRDGVSALAHKSPAAMREAQPVAIRGKIVGVHEGPSFISRSDGSVTRDNSVVVSVRVLEVFKDEESLVRDDLIYVSLPRGVTVLDERGHATPDDAAVPFQEVQRGLPTGLEVVVIARPRDDSEHLKNPATTREEAGSPLPTDATLLSGMHPQSFVVNPGDQPLNEWLGLSFAELVKELRVR